MTGFVFRNEQGDFAWLHGEEEIYDAIADIAELGSACGDTDEEIDASIRRYLEAAWTGRRLN